MHVGLFFSLDHPFRSFAVYFGKTYDDNRVTLDIDLSRSGQSLISSLTFLSTVTVYQFAAIHAFDISLNNMRYLKNMSLLN